MLKYRRNTNIENRKASQNNMIVCEPFEKYICSFQVQIGDCPLH